MLQRRKLNKKLHIDRILKDLENRRLETPDPSQGQVNTTNITSARVQKRIQTMEDDRKKWILSKAKTSEERELMSNVGVDTVSLETRLLDMTMKRISEDELTSLGHGLDEMLKYCRWSYYSCHKG